MKQAALNLNLSMKKARKRAPEMHSRKKGNQWHLGIKVHTGVAVVSGLGSTPCAAWRAIWPISLKVTSCCMGRKQLSLPMRGTRVPTNGLTPIPMCVGRWPYAPESAWELDKANNPINALVDKVEKLMSGICAKVEYPFRVLKHQFGFVKVRYRGLQKNTLQLKTLFVLSSLWMARPPLIAVPA